MKLNIDCCFFVLEYIENKDKRKNDTMKLKLLVDKDKNLLSVPYHKNANLKDTIRNKIESIIGSDSFHLEQVYTLGEKKFYDTGIHVIYLGVTNKKNVHIIDSHYQFIDFDIIDNQEIVFDTNIIRYKTKPVKRGHSLEYYHNIATSDVRIERIMIELLTSYKYMVSRIDDTDIMFQFLPRYFTLEDVRSIYEMLKKVTVDKSNFRKKIIKHCKITDKIKKDKGYRPTHLYEFILDEHDIWL